MSRSPRPNQVGSAPYAASSSRTAQVSPARPQPRPVSMPPPSVYMQVSRSGQIRSPCIHTSSPVFTSAVISCGESGAGPTGVIPNAAFTPSRNRAPPTPPTSTTTFTGAYSPMCARRPGSARSLSPEQEVVLPDEGLERVAAQPGHDMGDAVEDLGVDRPDADQDREQHQRGPRPDRLAEPPCLVGQPRLDGAPAVQ